MHTYPNFAVDFCFLWWGEGEGEGDYLWWGEGGKDYLWWGNYLVALKFLQVIPELKLIYLVILPMLVLYFLYDMLGELRYSFQWLVWWKHYVCFVCRPEVIFNLCRSNLKYPGWNCSPKQIQEVLFFFIIFFSLSLSSPHFSLFFSCPLLIPSLFFLSLPSSFLLFSPFLSSPFSFSIFFLSRVSCFLFSSFYPN